MSGNKSIWQKLMLPLLIILGFGAVILLKMGALFLMLGLLPSLVAYYTDNDESLTVFKTIFACNFAAMLPVIEPMVEAGLAFKPFNSFAVLSDPVNWLVAFSGAALGWCLIYLFQFIARFLVAGAYKHQIAGLEATQKALVKEWGKKIQKIEVAKSEDNAQKNAKEESIS